MMSLNNVNFACEMIQHVGLKRNKQEDQLIAAPHNGLFAVADGMGGHSNGAIASMTAIAALTTATAAGLRNPLSKVAKEIPMLYQRQASQMGVQPNTSMGTTLSALWFRQPGLVEILHWGDSRIYSLNGQGDPICLTNDHVARSPQGQSYISKALVYPSKLQQGDFSFMKAPRGCVFLLASDGYYQYFQNDPEALKAIMNEPNGLEIGKEIVLSKGADDNLSAIRVILQ